MDRNVLERPFAEALIKSRKGAFGQLLNYVEGSEYVKRLNEAFDAEWSFAVLEHVIREDEVIVLGKLSVNGISKTSFGGSSLTVSRETGELVSVADDLKSAATDSLKKACSMLGIGLHLYNESKSESAPTSRGSNGNGRGNGTSRNRLTQKQLSCIWSMGRSLGLNADQIRQRTVDVFGAVPEHLSKKDASAFITELGEALGSPAGGQR